MPTTITPTPAALAALLLPPIRANANDFSSASTMGRASPSTQHPLTPPSSSYPHRHPRDAEPNANNQQKEPTPRRRLKQPRHFTSTQVHSRQFKASPPLRRAPMPRRRKRNMRPLHLDVPALADAVAHSSHTDDLALYADADTDADTNDLNISPRSIRNSLNETDYDMDGNIRKRKSSVASANGHQDADDHTNPSTNTSSSATTEPSTVVHNGERRPSITNPDELRGPQCDAALAHLTGADLWVHRILATHHKTLETLGVERQAFPNTRLSLKQIETVINPVIALCNMMHPAQFGIRAPTPGIASAMTDTHYWKLWESDTIDVGIFFLPPGGVIPLHNHPGMSVVTRVLYGSAQVTSFDLVPKSELMELPADEVEAGKSDVKWALVSREGDFEAECTMWLDPRRFNLHQIRANDQIGCALLDIMIPPYDNADRDCHHFQILAEKILQKTEKRLVKLLESVQPDNHNQPSTNRS